MKLKVREPYYFRHDIKNLETYQIVPHRKFKDLHLLVRLSGTILKCFGIKSVI